MPLLSRWKQRRQEVDLTQEEVAEKLGITRGAVGHYEQGVHFPGKEVQEAACKLFNCQPDGLYEFVPEEEAVAV